jgi:hypothetical protein
MSEQFTDDAARWVVQRAATLASLGAEPVGPFVLPNAAFFPDKFDGSPASIGQLFERMKSHVGLDEVPTEVVLVDPDEGRVVSSCSSGSCGSGGFSLLAGQRVTEASEADGSRYIVQLATPEARSPVVLTTVFASALGEVFLREIDALKRFAPKERGAVADLAATLLGLGVIVANGSGIEMKGCGGVKVHAATKLTAPQAVFALAIAIERSSRNPKSATDLGPLGGQLDNVARGMFASALDVVRSNRDLVRRIDDAPGPIERGDFRIATPRIGLGSKVLAVLGLGRSRDVDTVDELERALASGQAPLVANKRAVDPARRAKLAELSELAEDALRTSGTAARRS